MAIGPVSWSQDTECSFIYLSSYTHVVGGVTMFRVMSVLFRLAGKLIAQCSGPTRPAICQLISRGDAGDMYTLSLKPLEVGQHTLTVTFNGEHVPGASV